MHSVPDTAQWQSGVKAVALLETPSKLSSKKLALLAVF